MTFALGINHAWIHHHAIFSLDHVVINTLFDMDACAAALMLAARFHGDARGVIIRSAQTQPFDGF